MIPAKKSNIFSWMFGLFHRQLMKYSFSEVYWRTDEHVPSVPAIFVANHSSWWDGMIFFHLSQKALPHNLHMMMHEKGLRQFPIFQWLGAFSVNRSNPKDILRSMKYANGLLQDGKSVCLFPQGDEFHLEQRPLGFESGSLFLLERSPSVPVVPISIYYTFAHKRKPEVWILAGRSVMLEDLDGDSRQEKTASLEKICTQQLELLKQHFIQKETTLYAKLL